MTDINLSRTQLETLIDEWIFSERDRAILKRRMLDGICFDQLSDEFNLSKKKKKNIVYKAKDRLFKHL